jgi:hypothetical protein
MVLREIMNARAVVSYRWIGQQNILSSAVAFFIKNLFLRVFLSLHFVSFQYWNLYNSKLVTMLDNEWKYLFQIVLESSNIVCQFFWSGFCSNIFQNTCKCRQEEGLHLFSSFACFSTLELN